MKVSIKKTFDFVVCITKDSLKEINEFLCSHFEYVKYSFEVKGGTKYDCDSIEDLINYSNPPERKIEKMMVFAGHDKYVTNFYMIIQQNVSQFRTICYEINNESEKDILFLSDKLNILIKNQKSPYSWIYGFWGLLILIVLMAVFHNICISKINGLYGYKDIRYISTCLMLVFGSCAIGYLYLEIVNFLFPISYFCWGHQSKEHNRNQFIKWVIANLSVGILASVLASIITN